MSTRKEYLYNVLEELYHNKQLEAEDIILGHQTTPRNKLEFKDNYERAKAGEFGTFENQIIIEEYESTTTYIRHLMDKVQEAKNSIELMLEADELYKAGQAIKELRLTSVAQVYDDKQSIGIYFISSNRLVYVESIKQLYTKVNNTGLTSSSIIDDAIQGGNLVAVPQTTFSTGSTGGGGSTPYTPPAYVKTTLFSDANGVKDPNIDLPLSDDITNYKYITIVTEIATPHVVKNFHKYHSSVFTIGTIIGLPILFKSNEFMPIDIVNNTLFKTGWVTGSAVKIVEIFASNE